MVKFDLANSVILVKLQKGLQYVFHATPCPIHVMWDCKKTSCDGLPSQQQQHKALFASLTIVFFKGNRWAKKVLKYLNIGRKLKHFEDWKIIYQKGLFTLKNLNEFCNFNLIYLQSFQWNLPTGVLGIWQSRMIGIYVGRVSYIAKT